MEEIAIQPNDITWNCLLTACANSAKLNLGLAVLNRLEGYASSKSLLLEGAIMNMHAKCGNLQEASTSFHKLHSRNQMDVGKWTAMIDAYSTQGKLSEAVKLFDKMCSEGHLPNSVTYVSFHPSSLTLPDCCSKSCHKLQLAVRIHVSLSKYRIEPTVPLKTALISMFSSCLIKQWQYLMPCMQLVNLI